MAVPAIPVVSVLVRELHTFFYGILIDRFCSNNRRTYSMVYRGVGGVVEVVRPKVGAAEGRFGGGGGGPGTPSNPPGNIL